MSLRWKLGFRGSKVLIKSNHYRNKLEVSFRLYFAVFAPSLFPFYCFSYSAENEYKRKMREWKKFIQKKFSPISPKFWKYKLQMVRLDSRLCLHKTNYMLFLKTRKPKNVENSIPKYFFPKICIPTKKMQNLLLQNLVCWILSICKHFFHIGFYEWPP